MTSLPPLPRRAPGLLLIVLLHAGLAYIVLQSRPRLAADEHLPQGLAIAWLRYTAPAPPRPIALRSAKPAAENVPRRTIPAPVSRPLPPPAVEQAPAPATPEAITAPPAPSAADILAQAKRDVGKIDKDLRKEFPQRGEQKLEDTGFKRMQQGFAEAYAAVPPKWYEASKIEEVGANEAKGSRTYKITSALGSLCVTTRAGKQGETMIGNCPK
ncbi:hypothetical protein P9875_07250 [Janthinobacterium rivuli]|uniref:Uncharacterized protein n=1 Tax=Janthinobacterium rivuli TaxID=2751478 RepID=A0ABY8I9X8_9BURK|nr:MULTISPECIES: hypothetical protein [Janthinobacterium]NVI83241.1 hypothetical protein [Janthinobacterium sp. BJB401]PHV34626.1 hypothetical protein CSQ94_04335 [Janthinobacterium sp. BJB312]WFR80953.1 hypothetical protein P9875_07250 [Janthinobacterium rivuli]